VNTTPRQLTLGISLGSGLDFENFIAGENEAALEAVRDASRSAQFVYLWGDAASGRTHLLHAACRAAADSGRRIALLPCAQAAQWEPRVLDGWEMLDLVALDDVEAIAGNSGWERAVFSLYNELRDMGASLLVTARRPPAALELMLPDLQSRLGAMLVYQLHALDDEGRLAALMRKAKTRGMDLPEDTGRYLMTRVSRDMRDLTGLLERLDQASLAHQRKLTIPFVRAQLESVG
jgi:DnaA family protein